MTVITKRCFTVIRKFSYHSDMKAIHRCGQATVEYIFILAFVVFLGLQVTARFTDFFRTSMGSVGHVLSTHLIIGACPEDCFTNAFRNGYNSP